MPKRLNRPKNFRSISPPHVCGLCRHYWETPDGQYWGCERRALANWTPTGPALSRSQYRHTCDYWSDSVIVTDIPATIPAENTRDIQELILALEVFVEAAEIEYGEEKLNWPTLMMSAGYLAEEALGEFNE